MLTDIGVFSAVGTRYRQILSASRNIPRDAFGVRGARQATPWQGHAREGDTAGRLTFPQLEALGCH